MTTIYDIARLSGVSKSTVSRVLNNHPYVSKDAKEKVASAIKKLHYTPNSRAVQFRLQMTKNIGIIAPMLDHPYFSRLISALSSECMLRGYKPVVYQTFFQEEREKEVYTKLIHKELDAVIITTSLFSEAYINELTASQTVVACNEDYEGTYFDVFSLDEEGIIYEATTSLLKQGLSNLVFCADILDNALQQSRLKGFIRAHEQYSITYRESYIYNHISTIEDGVQLGNSLFSGTLMCDGIVAGSDFVAAGLLKSARKHCIHVPKDVSIIGFDNHQISTITAPELSTICNHIQEMITDVFDRLVHRLNGGDTPYEKKVYTGTLIIRESCVNKK
ncbi:LacI family DNA-binding transcriptional regulator [Priestia taiwanensis]|uniref:NTD biosynthesis operon regulator NtdR n=1 Tax=Priestia taiwanensis TaxID=1347902 RepID=A0A917EPW6_9BACI|nr:LacI family DNA-binding transcriptional regulator [Priestia taiwanensis]MBM7362615.1 DNA-binding LacI/PurR family transcriptional regulator [Priestia taiwanensis]GGE63681.1 NTD biosynthesis operon regulator NtdR [Priestia taiwanensis]